jgi:SpoVK/Ycf46/Vps4 family AAA+-type ATPase
MVCPKCGRAGKGKRCIFDGHELVPADGKVTLSASQVKPSNTTNAVVISATGTEKTVSVEDALKELNELVGLKPVKDQIIKIVNTLKVQKLTGEVLRLYRHFVFTGNPGTGKTTVARLLGKIFKEYGLLHSGHVVEVDRSKLVAGYVGQSAVLVNEQCDKAMGGILFVDEAYALKRGLNDAFGDEALDALLKRLENDRGKFIVIISGYAKEMNEFLQIIPGVRGKFSHYITFEE